EQHACVAGCVQVLGRIKAQDRHRAKTSGAASVALGQYGLRGVFYDQSLELLNLGNLTKDVHGDDRASFLCDLCRVEIERVAIDIREYRTRANPSDAAGRCEKRESGDSHFITRSNSK